MKRTRRTQSMRASFQSVRGQALLLAVIIMLLILLIGGLFVASVVFNQTNTAIHTDMTDAQALAMAGIQFANHMLMTSPEGADWRPAEPPVEYTDGSTDPQFDDANGDGTPDDPYYTEMERSRGWSGLRNGTAAAPAEFVRRGYTKYPDPRRQGSIGAADAFLFGNGTVLLRVTYNPQVGDPNSRFVVIESIGRVDGPRQVWRYVKAYKPLVLTDYGRFIADRENSGTPAKLGINPYFDFNDDGVQQPWDVFITRFEGAIHSNVPLIFVGDNPTGTGGGETNVITLLTVGSGNLDNQTVRAPDFILEPRAPSGVTNTRIDFAGGGPAPLFDSSDPMFDTHGDAVHDARGIADAGGIVRTFHHMNAPAMLQEDPDTGEERWQALTRESGVYVSYTDPQTGALVGANTGEWGHGDGVFIDNASEVQFAHSTEDLEADWLRHLDFTSTTSMDSGWNALYTTYSPPGVEITLFPDEAAACGNNPANIQPTPATVAPGTDDIWWPNHQPGAPGIRLERHDKAWLQPDGSPSGLYVMYLDYPTNGVIAAEGNVRISGILPPLGTGGAVRPDGSPRDFNLTVYSDATIYIDGPLLRPSTAGLTGVGYTDSRVALIARDCVCLNSTYLVPQLAAGTVPVVSDDPLNPDAGMHWQLDGSGSVYTIFSIPPALAGPANLVVKQAGEDPGPALMDLMVNGVAYAFGPGVPPPAAPLSVLPTQFAFVPAGLLPPGPQVSYALSPRYEYLTNPVNGLPWTINLVPGWNTITFTQSAPGSTEYWLRKFKLEIPGGLVTQHVDALVLAERGSWFVIPGDYFEPDPIGDLDRNRDGLPDVDVNGDGSGNGADFDQYATRFKRYNYQIIFTGCIVEDHPADPEAVRDWTDKWAYPIYGAGGNVIGWDSIQYRFDDSYRLARDDPSLTGGRESNLAALPALPVSEDLIVIGQP